MNTANRLRHTLYIITVVHILISAIIEKKGGM